MVATIAWLDDAVVMLDQRLLPEQEIYRTYHDYREVADAIKTMVIRGAPAIGIAAAMGIALGARTITATTPEQWLSQFETITSELAATRPTAVNLFWAVERMRQLAAKKLIHGISGLAGALKTEAIAMLAEDIAINNAMGMHGQELLSDGDVVLTHCNAGALATGGFGTALGVIRAARLQGKNIKVFADETRPFLQGARLTAWELTRDHIPTTLITDNMAGHFMQLGAISSVIVGADRIAANGDVANKIGTYSVAILARYHSIPMYIAAPLSTIDLKTPQGSAITIEERPEAEVRMHGGKIIAPATAAVRNPAFDVTPHALITAIITEQGIARPPFARSLPALFTKP